jgi:hypothetical protein
MLILLIHSCNIARIIQDFNTRNNNNLNIIQGIEIKNYRTVNNICSCNHMNYIIFKNAIIYVSSVTDDVVRSLIITLWENVIREKEYTESWISRIGRTTKFEKI